MQHKQQQQQHQSYYTASSDLICLTTHPPTPSAAQTAYSNTRPANKLGAREFKFSESFRLKGFSARSSLWNTTETCSSSCWTWSCTCVIRKANHLLKWHTLTHKGPESIAKCKHAWADEWWWWWESRDNRIGLTDYYTRESLYYQLYGDFQGEVVLGRSCPSRN